MRLWKFPASITGHLVTAVTMSLLIIGPAACNNFNILGTQSVDAQGNPLGFLFNTDNSSSILGGIRADDGSAIFVYGTRNADGSFAQITGAAYVDAAGKEASITFENGLFKRATSTDGSTVEVTYNEVSTVRLSGSVNIHFADAAVAEADRDQSFDFDVDLLQAAADLARQVQELMGLTVSSEEPPDSDDRVRAADPVSLTGGKDAADAQFILGLIVLPFQMSFVSVGFACVQVMTQLVAVMVSTIVQLVVTLTTTIVTAVCAPFIMMAEMMRMALAFAPISIDIELDLNINIPTIH